MCVRTTTAIDCHVLTGSLWATAVSGPTHSDVYDVPPFSWSTSNWNNTPHLGMPDLWVFPWVDVEF